MKNPLGNSRMQIALLAILLSAGCGDDEPTSQPDMSVLDIVSDTAPDAEQEPDLPIDPAPDIPIDPTPDVVSDVQPDVTPDIVADVQQDLAPDTEPDTISDLGQDIEPDLPAQTVELSFAIDDTANQSYTGGLAFFGSFVYHESVNLVTFDSDWTGPFVPLWDDGPVTGGGHEREGATAGDHVWSVTVLVEVTDSEQTFEYGAIQNYIPGTSSTEGLFLGEWIWPFPENGTFSVPANTIEDIELPTLVLPHFGWVDARFNLDTLDLDADFTDPGTITSVQVKSSAWGWTAFEMVDDGTQDVTSGDGVYSFNIWANLGESRPVNGEGLGRLLPGQDVEFVLLINEEEYRVDDVAAEQGVTVGLWLDRFFVSQTVDVNERQNTSFTVLDGWIPVNFSIDDTANQTYGSLCPMGDPTCDGLAFKGTFGYDYHSRTMVFDDSWGGPYALVYDDGPWSEGGHEPAAAVAGDHIWSISAWVQVTGVQQVFEYGAIRSYENDMPAAEAETWIWLGSDGTFSVGADQTEPIDVTGLTIPEFDGVVDLLIGLDTNALAGGWTFDSATDSLTTKGNVWGWEQFDLHDDGLNGDAAASDGRYTFQLSTDASIHDDLLHITDRVFFLFVIDGAAYVEGGNALGNGVSAWSDFEVTGEYEPEEVISGMGNTQIVIGEPDRVGDCAGESDFTFCYVDTTDDTNGDLWYDICIDQTCLSPGSCGTIGCNVAGPHFPIPPADVAPSAYSRQEPDPSGYPGEYIVTDSSTGLIWQGCHAGKTGSSCETADAGVAETYTYNNGIVHCENLDWASFDDWYLPDEYELQSILDYGTHHPAIDTVAFPGEPASEYFWSSSTHEAGSGYAWRVAFGYDGSVYGGAKTYELSVRCVRRASVDLPYDRFTRMQPDAVSHSSDWVVQDFHTGLMWQACLAGQTAELTTCTGDATSFSWADADDYCAVTLSGAAYAGYSDWILPDIKQLRSIVYNRGTPTGAPIDEAAFPATLESGVWSSTPYSTIAWFVDFSDDGQVFAEPPANLKLVRCVREMP